MNEKVVKIVSIILVLSMLLGFVSTLFFLKKKSPFGDFFIIYLYILLFLV